MLLPLFLLAAGVILFAWHCPFRALTGIPCPGCGMTRAMRCLLVGNLAQSLAWHPMAVPTLVSGLTWGALMLAGKKKAAWTVLMIWAGLMLACWLIRLLLVFPHNSAWQKTGLLQKFLTWLSTAIR